MSTCLYSHRLDATVITRRFFILPIKRGLSVRGESSERTLAQGMNDEIPSGVCLDVIAAILSFSTSTLLI